MAMNKKSINLIFALIVIGLGSAAVYSIYMSSGNPLLRTGAREGPSSEPLPENQPPVETDQQLAALIQMSMEDPQNADIQTGIGNLYYDRQDFDKAIIYYQKSLDLQSFNPYVETDLATCFHYVGRNDEALKLLDHVLENRPGFEQALYNKGIVLIHGNNDIESGIAVWEELLKSDLEPAKRAELEKGIQQLKSSIR
jgi:tetratricopeptide (TPR) repeat protein